MGGRIGMFGNAGSNHRRFEGGKEQGSRQKEGGEAEGQLDVLHRLPLASIWHISEPGVKQKLLFLQRRCCLVQAG